MPQARSKFIKNLPILFLTLALLLPGGSIVRAQSSARMEVYRLQADAFPLISGGMDLYDSQGNFITGLPLDAFTVVEDDHSLPLDSLDESVPGVHFAVAINASPAFARQDAFAVSRLDTIEAALMDWATIRESGEADDLSLVAVGAQDAAHLDAVRFKEAVQAYQPDAGTLLPSMDILSRALDLAAGADRQNGEKGAVLYITSLPDPENFALLQNLALRAIQLKVRIFVWIVANEDQFNIAGATALKDLALLTGGQYVVFSGVEALPTPEVYLAPLRHTYSFRYTSKITNSGNHKVTMQISTDAQMMSAEPLFFEVQVLPPSPILVSVPNQIVRSAGIGSNPQESDLVPSTQEIEMLIEFPDAHRREITRTVLYVDSEVMDENTTAPFEFFSWDLRAYRTSGEHLLQVEAVDSLGLSQVSLGVPVTVTVIQPVDPVRKFLLKNAPWLTVGAVILLGSILTAILTIGKSKNKGKRRESARREKDPVTQPIQAVQAASQRRLTWTKRIRPASAYLIRLKPNGEAITAPPTPLLGEEILFGADPTRATNLLTDESVAPLHARLTRESDTDYVLVDQDSPAGTWVNYEQITHPTHLQHGDLVQIGRVAYRFMLRDAPAEHTPRVVRRSP